MIRSKTWHQQAQCQIQVEQKKHLSKLSNGHKRQLCLEQGKLLRIEIYQNRRICSQYKVLVRWETAEMQVWAQLKTTSWHKAAVQGLTWNTADTRNHFQRRPFWEIIRETIIRQYQRRLTSRLYQRRNKLALNSLLLGLSKMNLIKSSLKTISARIVWSKRSMYRFWSTLHL